MQDQFEKSKSDRKPNHDGFLEFLDLNPSLNHLLPGIVISHFRSSNF